MANTYVLVHGSWHGGWGWTAVAKHLTELGHKVYAPTLAGHGPDVERAGVTHQDCVETLVQYIEQRDLRNIILVGHSWGGNMLCGAAPRIADRLQRLIFWSAFVLNDGESLMDSLPPHYQALFRQLADSSSDYTVSLPLLKSDTILCHMKLSTQSKKNRLFLRRLKKSRTQPTRIVTDFSPNVSGRVVPWRWQQQHRTCTRIGHRLDPWVSH